MSDKSPSFKTLSDHLRDELGAPKQAEVNLRSEAVQDIMGRRPRWMIRWGITVILTVVLGLFVGSYFIKYPDIVKARVLINSEHLPVHVVSMVSGRIDSLFVSDGQRVHQGDIVVLLETPTVLTDYMIMQSEWRRYRQLCFNDDTVCFYSFSTDLQLGELQSSYSALIKSYSDYWQFVSLNYHKKKIEALQLQIRKQRQIAHQYERQQQSVQRQIEIAQSTFRTDSILYTEGIISFSEYERGKHNFLASLQSVEHAKNATKSQEITILQNEQMIYDLEREYQVQLAQYRLNFTNSKEQFWAQVKSWEQNYLLRSPMAGTITFTKFSQPHQNVRSGEVLLTVVPDRVERLMGKLYLPQQGAGKVKLGQSVNIKFEHFPYLEYGMVRVQIQNISLVPIDENGQSVYVLDISFPHGLQTNYGKTLSFTQNMEGTAEIITEDLRLLDKFINPIKAIFKR